MRDVVVIMSTLGFFALCVAYVALCDRIIGPDEVEADVDAEAAEPGVAHVAVAVGTGSADADADADGWAGVR